MVRDGARDARLLTMRHLKLLRKLKAPHGEEGREARLEPSPTAPATRAALPCPAQSNSKSAAILRSRFGRTAAIEAA